MPLSDFNPISLATTNHPIFAPFFADVDTSTSPYPNQTSIPTDIVTYGTGTVNGHKAFGVTWNSVGYYYQNTDKVNTFQVVLIDLYDKTPPENTGVQQGDFAVEFNYNQIQWDTGDASGGSGGLAEESIAVDGRTPIAIATVTSWLSSSNATPSSPALSRAACQN